MQNSETVMSANDADLNTMLIPLVPELADNKPQSKPPKVRNSRNMVAKEDKDLKYWKKRWKNKLAVHLYRVREKMIEQLHEAAEDAEDAGIQP